MKQIKYAYNGGLPLSQNVLDWMQTGSKEVFAAIGKLAWQAGDPIIMHGCNDAGGGVYNTGWIFDGTEAYYFQGGDSVAAGTTKIKLTEITTTVVFEDGGNQPIYTRKEYVFDATGVDITTLSNFHSKFGTAYGGIEPATSGKEIVAIAGGTGNLAGAITCKKSLLIPALQLVGAITASTPSAFSSPPVYQTVGTIATAGLRPLAEVPFKAFVETYPLEIGGTEHFTDVNCRVRIDGKIDVAFIKPDAGVGSYTVKLNILIPLTAI